MNEEGFWEGWGLSPPLALPSAPSHFPNTAPGIPVLTSSHLSRTQRRTPASSTQGIKALSTFHRK